VAAPNIHGRFRKSASTARFRVLPTGRSHPWKKSGIRLHFAASFTALKCRLYLLFYVPFGGKN
jgi:hypothetical protein